MIPYKENGLIYVYANKFSTVHREIKSHKVKSHPSWRGEYLLLIKLALLLWPDMKVQIPTWNSNDIQIRYYSQGPPFFYVSKKGGLCFSMVLKVYWYREPKNISIKFDQFYLVLYNWIEKSILISCYPIIQSALTDFRMQYIIIIEMLPWRQPSSIEIEQKVFKEYLVY